MKCHWFHRWVDVGFVGGIALPVMIQECSKCGAMRKWRLGP